MSIHNRRQILTIPDCREISKKTKIPEVGGGAAAESQSKSIQNFEVSQKPLRNLQDETWQQTELWEKYSQRTDCARLTTSVKVLTYLLTPANRARPMRKDSRHQGEAGGGGSQSCNTGVKSGVFNGEVLKYVRFVCRQGSVRGGVARHVSR